MTTQAEFDALKVAHDAALAELNKLRFKVFAQHEQAQQESEQTIANLRIALGEAVKVPMLQKHISQLEGLVARYEKRVAKLEAEPAFDTERQPQSEFFTARLIDQGELPWVEIRALASIGAGLLMRHLGDPKAINKLGRLAVSFDSVHHNMTAKARTVLLDDAGGGPYDLSEQDWIDLAALAGYKGKL
jgi:hypothetical protein